MSEEVIITLILEKENEIRQEINVTHDSNMTLMSTLLKEKLISGAFCGGRGTCKRCRVQFLQAAPIPTELERSTFEPDELRKGYRLACMTRPKSSCVIRLDLIESVKPDIITNVTDVSETINQSSQQANTIIMESNTDVINLSNQKNYLVAVDLGTTTIAMQCVDMESGQVVDTYCALNPQRSYGADVLSRIQAANAGHAKELQDCVWNVIIEGVQTFLRKIHKTGHEAGSVHGICIAGNTTMEHLLMGLPTESLGRSPFTPVEIGLQKCSLSVEADTHKDALPVEVDMHKDALPAGTDFRGNTLPVYIAPGISTFVGGDIVAGLYHCNLFGNLSGAVLFIDLGTNGEMAILHENRMIVTATAAGPAFEGGAGAAVLGSDMVALTASLLDQEMIDETGLLKDPYFEEGIRITADGAKAAGYKADAADDSTETILLTQADIRALQMAKAAVRAGVEILCEKMGRPRLAKVYLAGGFGYYLDVDAAVRIGLLPEGLQSCTLAAGNTSLAGAFEMGRDLWSGRLREEDLAQRLHQIESINLAKQENFEKLYLQYLNFPL